MPNRPPPSGRPPAPKPKRTLPKCELEVVNPDDVLVMSINQRWFRSFTSNSDRYPLTLEIPPGFLNDGYNLVTGDYTNVALPGERNDVTVEYKILLDGKEVVHVNYQTEVEAHTFTIHFKDSFSSGARERTMGTARIKKTGRFQDLMDWQKE
jgi:hypothetical protein